jgi:tetratricopeptide (TPR) repeat protein
MTIPETPVRDSRLEAALSGYHAPRPERRAAERAAIFDRHPELVEELRAFFEHEDRIDGVLSELGDGPPRAAVPGYTIVGVLGRGEMGLVYEARQQRPDRRVALKVLRAGLFATPDEVRRFRNEAESAATLDHPNIVPIYEVGEIDGHPYFSMKRVEGGTLADRIETFRDRPRVAAGLIAAVARAVDHAHRRGILHRDLKPANILLARGAEVGAGVPTPYVADFGLAKRLGDGELTASGSVLGSPPYMAPEQAGGPRSGVTVATDVYGLGAILYATLTGRPPFRGESVAETLRILATCEAEPPSRTNRRVARDLEAIVLKCLEKDPARRYPTAAAVADDLDRYLRGELVEARRPSAGDRLVAWYRRDPRLACWATLAAALAVSLVAALAISYAMLARSHGETVASLRTQVALRRDAEAHLRAAIAGVDDAMRAVHDPALDGEPAVAPLRARIRSEARALIASLIDEGSVDPDRRLASGIALVHLAGPHLYAGEVDEAERALRRAAAVLASLAADVPDSAAARFELAQSLSILGHQRRLRGAIDEAHAFYLRAQDAYRAALTLDPGSSSHTDQVAWILATCPDPTIRDPRRALDLARRAVALAPKAAGAWRTLAAALEANGEPRAALEAMDRRRVLGDGSMGTGWDELVLARVRARLGEPDAAGGHLARAAAWIDRNDPHSPELRLLQAEAGRLVAGASAVR